MDFGWLRKARSDGLKVLRLIEAWLRGLVHAAYYRKICGGALAVPSSNKGSRLVPPLHILIATIPWALVAATPTLVEFPVRNGSVCFHALLK